jgi:hypothetical protein
MRSLLFMGAEKRCLLDLVLIKHYRIERNAQFRTRFTLLKLIGAMNISWHSAVQLEVGKASSKAYELRSAKAEEDILI